MSDYEQYMCPRCDNYRGYKCAEHRKPTYDELAEEVTKLKDQLREAGNDIENVCGQCDGYVKEIEQLKHIIDVAERLDAGEVIHEDQPHPRLWQIVAGNRASMQGMADACEETRKTKEALADAHFAINRWANASQVVGTHRSCSCAVCEALYDFQEKSRESRSCRWRYDDIHAKYDTACGHAWMFTEGSREDHGVKYCPFCGGEVTEKEDGSDE